MFHGDALSFTVETIRVIITIAASYRVVSYIYVTNGCVASLSA